MRPAAAVVHLGGRPCPGPRAEIARPDPHPFPQPCSRTPLPASYYAANTAVNVYVDERDFRKAVADEKRAAWAETAAGQAQLAELAAADARASEAEEQRQLRLMETDHGREELAQARRIKVAECVVVSLVLARAPRVRREMG